MKDRETDPVARHDVCQGQIVRARIVGLIRRDESVRRAVQFSSGSECEFEHG